MSDLQTLGHQLPKEMARVRDEVMPAYQEIGMSGYMALEFMKRDLNYAAQAMAEGDLVAMIRAYKVLQEYHV